MTLTSYKAKAINRLAAPIKRCLERCDSAPPKSFRNLAAAMVTESLRKGYQGHAEIYPGRAKMAKWAGCSPRHVTRLLRELEALQIITPISGQKGGRISTRFWVEPEALIRFAMSDGGNPHPDLMSEIRDHVKAVRVDMRGDMRLDIFGDTRLDKCPPVYSKTNRWLGGDEGRDAEGRDV